MVIRPGMSVRADIYTESSQETLAVPVGAVRYDEELDDSTKGQDEQAFVFVVEDGKAVRKDVKTGISSDSEQEILEGLVEGEIVITGPFRVLRHLQEGEEVEEKDEDEDGDSDVTVTID